MALWERW